MNKSTGKTYTITTLSDLFEVVNLDNVDTLAADIRLLLVSVASAKKLAESMDEVLDGTEFEPSVEWTDDNIKSATTHITDQHKNSLGNLIITGKSYDNQGTE